MLTVGEWVCPTPFNVPVNEDKNEIKTKLNLQKYTSNKIISFDILF